MTTRITTSTPARTRRTALTATIAFLATAGTVLTHAAGAAVSTSPSAFVPITPCRLVDTRPAPDNVGARTTPLHADETFVAAVAGTNGHCHDLPTDATAVSMNVTIIEPTSSSFLTVFPADATTRPLTANLTWTAKQAPTPNAVTSALSADGRLGFYNLSGTVDLAVDIVGYYRPITRTPGPQGDPGAPGPVSHLSPTDLAELRWDHDPTAPGSLHIGSAVAGPTELSIAFDGTHLWVAKHGDVVEVDRVSGAVLATVPMTGTATRLVFDGSSIWATAFDRNEVDRIDVSTRTVSGTVTVGSDPIGVAFDGVHVWVANHGGASVSEIDRTTMVVVATMTVGGGPEGVAFDGTSVWVMLRDQAAVAKIDPVHLTLSGPFHVGRLPDFAAFDGADLWVTNEQDGSVSAVDSDGVVIATVPVGGNPSDITFDGRNVWVVGRPPGSTLTRIDPTSATVTGTFTGLDGPTLNGPQDAVFADGDDVWVGSYLTGQFVSDPSTLELLKVRS